MSNIVKAPRKVTILFTQTAERKEIETSAVTWGELQQEIGVSSVSNKKCVLRETKVTLESVQAILPETPFVIFAYPRESKAGAKAKKAAKKSAKKTAKKAAKKVAKKTASKKVSSKKISKGAGSKVASVVSSVAASKAEPAAVKTDDLLNEARDLKRTF